jgi:hypothetical protein
MWPLPGWWSVDEWSAPISCRMPEACPGVDVPTALTNLRNGTLVPPAIAPDTQRCAPRYTGHACVQCASGFYQLDAGTCFACGSPTDQSREVSEILRGETHTAEGVRTGAEAKDDSDAHECL